MYVPVYGRGINWGQLYCKFIYVESIFPGTAEWKSWVCFAGLALQAFDPHDIVTDLMYTIRTCHITHMCARD
jgi:hypothetical protein